MTQQLFAAICPTFGARFAFNAKDQKDAEWLMYKWNSYHSYRGADIEHTAKEITEDQLTNLRIAIHNEYVM